jgi:hypothetical protein
MKMLLVLGLILLLFAGFQLYVSMNTQNTEKASYEILEKEDSIELRYYPPALFATTKVEGNYKQSSGQGFQVLASYIFGSNKKEQKIAMTSPVHMKMGDEAEMSFVMPSEMKKEDLPEPNSPRIKINETPPRYVACLRFGGFANDSIIAEKASVLKAYLANKNIRYIDKLVFL